MGELFGLAFIGGCVLLALWQGKERSTFRPDKPIAKLYIERVPTESEIAANYTGAKFEPRVGCLLGAYIDLDPNLKQVYRDQNGKYRRIPQEFEAIVGKPHASYFFYLGYGQSLPMDWVRHLAQEGRYVHIALEPNDGLDSVQADGYLTRLAKDMAASGARIFLRFASEMNGPWTRYHGDPRKYIQKWRLVTQTMRAHAPNVAMLWCPYTTPKTYIADYYPGDEWVDWVGVNMYSVTYYNLQRNRPGWADHPADLLRWMYQKYSSRKPMMIAEYAATHFSAVEGTPCIEFARDSIATLYQVLPRLFPRVKCITYFNTNNLLLQHRKNNNYSVTDAPEVTEAYRRAIAPTYFLSSDLVPEPFLAPLPLNDGEELVGRVRLSVVVRSPERNATVRVLIDGVEVFRSSDPGDREFELVTNDYAVGDHDVTVEAYRPRGALAARTKLRLRFRHAPEGPNHLKSRSTRSNATE
jgi:hypothetical protein